MPPERDPGVEGEPMGNDKADEDLAGLKTEDQDEYDVEEPVLDNKPQNNKPENIGIGTSAFPTAIPQCQRSSLLRGTFVFLHFSLLLLCSSQ